MRLYEIGAELRALLAMVEDNAGELVPEVEAKLTSLSGAFDTKAEGVALWHREREAEAAAIEDEIVRLKARQLAAARSAAWAKQYLEREMIAAGVKAVKSPRVSVTLCRNGTASVRLAIPTERLPDKFLQTVTTTAPDRQAILDAAKAGEKLPDGVYVSHGTHVRIR